MFRNKKLLTFVASLIATIFVDVCPTQLKEHHYCFVMNNDSVEVRLVVENLLMKKNDSLELQIFIKNNSLDTLIIFEDIYFSYTESEKFGKNIVLVYGGLFQSGIEWQVKMRKVNPLEVWSLKGWLTYKYVFEKNINEIFSVLLSFGVIPSMKRIKENEYLGNIKSEILDENRITLSSLVVEASLNRFEVRTFYFKTQK